MVVEGVVVGGGVVQDSQAERPVIVLKISQIYILPLNTIYIFIFLYFSVSVLARQRERLWSNLTLNK